MSRIMLSRFLVCLLFGASQSFATLLSENPFCKADPDCPYIKKVFIDVLPPWNHQLIEGSSDVSKEGFALVYQAVEKTFEKWNKITGRKKYEVARARGVKIPNFDKEKKYNPQSRYENAFLWIRIDEYVIAGDKYAAVSMYFHHNANYPLEETVHTGPRLIKLGDNPLDNLAHGLECDIAPLLYNQQRRSLYFGKWQEWDKFCK